MFSGTLRVKICEASGLKPTDYQKRHELNFGKNNDKKDLDPYVSMNVDEKFIGKSHCRLLFSACVQKIAKVSTMKNFGSIKWAEHPFFQRLFSLLAFRIGRQCKAMYRMLSETFVGEEKIAIWLRRFLPMSPFPVYDDFSQGWIFVEFSLARREKLKHWLQFSAFLLASGLREKCLILLWSLSTGLFRALGWSLGSEMRRPEINNSLYR